MSKYQYPLFTEKIDDQLPLEENRNANYDECINNGVIALFGEKYGDVVRSIKFGFQMNCGELRLTLDK